jgi:RNA polymerase sigma-70 factor (ECF subfamily)
MLRRNKKLSQLTDEALMQLLSTRLCNLALTEIHERYSKKVLGFFIRMTKGNVEKSQDLVQDLFLRILEKNHLFDPTKKFYTWMFTIASNMVKSSYSEKNHSGIEEGSKEFNFHHHFSENRLDKEVFHQLLSLAIEQLENHHSMVFVLRYMEELSIKEIAEIIEQPEGTVKSRLFYATKKVTQKLNDFRPEQVGQHFKLN